MKILVYAPSLSPRVKYAFHLLFRSCLKADYELVDKPEHYASAGGPRVNYSPAPLSEGELWLPAGNLLWEEGIREQAPEVFRHDGLPAFFRLEYPGAAMPFDLPALAFYLASRYEEYLHFEADAHGRFPASQSLAFREGFLEQPLVSQWAFRLGKMLEERFPGQAIHYPAYRFLPTYDIDMAWAYRHRPLWLNLAATLRSLATAQWPMALERLACLLGKKADPFDTFSYLKTLHRSKGTSALFFFLLGDTNRYDKNASPNHPAMRQLITQLADRRPVGLHPSYRSNFRQGQLHKEVLRLKKITGENVSRSRQHFLLLRFPETYRRLLKEGIREDYTMGFADAVGFRAGMAGPFRWYDLGAEKAQPLTIFPFMAMDVTLRRYMSLSPEEAFARLQHLCGQCREVGGFFITLWHNSSFAEEHGWQGWREMYEKIISFARESE
ncbi:MAG: polysaccharide deacetylase family protein [Phaeodactylibacter sp.]|nr:polysaccharide deacetylase family protein [Phaeodactylibacter sp.]MCB9285735.1 polysaccharide deacetylase family protein [Lewinellaceae bacterium]